MGHIDVRCVIATVGLLSGGLSVAVWVSAARGKYVAEVVHATVASAMAAGPPLVCFGLIGAVSNGHAHLLAALMRYWILVGPACLLWSYWGYPWSRDTRVELARVSHVVVWMSISLLSLMTFFVDGPIN